MTISGSSWILAKERHKLDEGRVQIHMWILTCMKPSFSWTMSMRNNHSKIMNNNGNGEWRKKMKRGRHYMWWHIKWYTNITEIKITCLVVWGLLKFESVCELKAHHDKLQGLFLLYCAVQSSLNSFTVTVTFITYHPLHSHYAKVRRCWTPTETCKFQNKDTFLLANQITF